MGKFIEDRYEAEFTIEKSQEEVWQALLEENETENRFFSAFPRMEGFDRTAEVIEVDAPRLIRATKVAEPCKDTEIAITLESVSNGTRVKVVQSGFPAWVQGALETFTIGGDQIVCDLVLYLDRGIEMSRHSMPWAFAGFTADEVDTGLEIRMVVPGCFGERAGLAPGDLLMTIAGAPVFNQLELQALLRLIKTGDNTEVTYVRRGTLEKAHAVM